MVGWVDFSPHHRAWLRLRHRRWASAAGFPRFLKTTVECCQCLQLLAGINSCSHNASKVFNLRQIWRIWRPVSQWNLMSSVVFLPIVAFDMCAPALSCWNHTSRLPKNSFVATECRSYFFVCPPCIADTDIIFSSCHFFFLLPSLFSSPNLSGRRADVYHTSTYGVTLVQI